MRISQIAEQLFPFWNYCKYSKRLKKQCDVEVDPCAKELADYQKLPQEQLRQRLKEEHQRASAMDEKTFKLTFSLSVGLTVLGSTIAYLTQVIPSGMVQKFLIGVIGIGLIYILAAGFMALGAVRTRETYGFGTEFLLQLQQEENVQVVLADALACQEKVNIIRRNRNETAYQAIRIGFGALFVGIIVFLVTLMYHSC